MYYLSARMFSLTLCIPAGWPLACKELIRPLTALVFCPAGCRTTLFANLVVTEPGCTRLPVISSRAMLPVEEQALT